MLLGEQATIGRISMIRELRSPMVNAKANSGANRPLHSKGNHVTRAIAADHETGKSFKTANTPKGHQGETLPDTRVNGSLLDERNSSAGTSVSPRIEAEHALSACRWQPSPHHLSKAQLWAAIRDEASEQARTEPILASYLHMTVITHSSVERGLAFLLANKLASGTLLATQLIALISQAYKDDPDLLDACVADIQAVKDRDPACFTHVQCLLFFKGFQAIQAYRVAHWMWRKGRRSLALAIQSRISEVFGVDIHPAAVLGRGIMMDHASGIVIGETAIVGDNVVMLHHVSLGGSGTGKGVRHPTIGNGVLVGAGVSVLGPVVIGHCTKIGAGSVVVTDLPAHCVAVGVPAQVVKRLDDNVEPVKEMDMTTDFILDYII